MFIFINTFSGVEVSEKKQDGSDKKKSNSEKLSLKNTKGKLPDKELLLFLSEFSDTNGNWVDPEVFNQSYTEIKNSSIELEELKNEDRPNKL